MTGRRATAFRSAGCVIVAAALAARLRRRRRRTARCAIIRTRWGGRYFAVRCRLVGAVTERAAR
ncbi:hypothetical protein LUX33_27135 [Actinomadura madurae]|uniref:hypothetical protein n=1 Tax=Actinomadura madurae TaxID=1993 RepID=UPI0020D2533F|nr:hypothetical protein [Actinomadura madurae]MCP9951746.1 hypothetical protein [Actinomadura madurae]